MHISSSITPSQTSTLLLIDHICSGLSFIGCTVILCFFIKTWKFWTHSGKMIICLVFANLIYSIINLLGLLDPDFRENCRVDGPFRTFSILASFFWATRISLLAFRATATSSFNPNQSTGFLLGFLGPLVIAVIPSLGIKAITYDNVGINCDFSSNQSSLQAVWLSCFLLVPMIFGVFLTTYYSIKVVKSIRGFEKAYGVRAWHFLAHPVALIVVWLPGIVFRIAYLCGYYATWLEGANLLFSCSSGLINMIIYGWQSFNVKKRHVEVIQQDGSNSLLERLSWKESPIMDVESANEPRKSKALMIM